MSAKKVFLFIFLASCSGYLLGTYLSVEKRHEDEQNQKLDYLFDRLPALPYKYG